jgi:hypothetical protein
MLLSGGELAAPAKDTEHLFVLCFFGFLVLPLMPIPKGRLYSSLDHSRLSPSEEEMESDQLLEEESSSSPIGADACARVNPAAMYTGTLEMGRMLTKAVQQGNIGMTMTVGSVGASGHIGTWWVLVRGQGCLQVLPIERSWGSLTNGASGMSRCMWCVCHCHGGDESKSVD